MSKEVKVGLGVIFSLTMVLGYSVYDRFFPAAADAIASSGEVVAPSESRPLTQVLQPESPTPTAPRFDTVAAAQWEEVADDSSSTTDSIDSETSVRSLMPRAALASTDETPTLATTFREVEKPVIQVAAEGGVYEPPSSNAVVPNEAASSAPQAQAAEQVYAPAPLQPLPYQQQAPGSAAQDPQGSGYQPPRVLAEGDQLQQQSPVTQRPVAQQPVAQQPIRQQPLPTQAVDVRQYAPAAQTPPEAAQVQNDYPGSASGRGYAEPAPRETQLTEYRQMAQTGNSRVSNRGGYSVRPNDTFWTISQQVYGSGSFFKALARHNEEEYPAADQLAVGDIVETPSMQELMQAYPDLCPKPRAAAAGGRFSSVSSGATDTTGARAYEVQEGDTLFDIARYELGDGSRWIEIYDLNQRQLTQDFNYIKPGTTIMLPGRGGARQKKAAVASEQNGRRLR